MSTQHPGQKNLPLPVVTETVLEIVKQACMACENKQGDVFVTCLRKHGATAAAVTSVILHLMPNLSDTAILPIKTLLEAIEQHLGVEQAA